jgi:thiol-disulfide isomerase/thioredoxin
MYKISLSCLAIMTGIFLFAQSGSVVQKTNVSTDGNTRFIYRPANTVSLTENTKAYVMYMPYNFKIASIIPTPDAFAFDAKLPDTIKAVLVILRSKTGELIDDNGGNGFIIRLGEGNNSISPSDQLELLKLQYFASRAMGMKINGQELVKNYEALFQNHPSLKSDDDYLDFLFARMQFFPEGTPALMTAFAEELERKGDEKSLRLAFFVYRNTKNVEKADEIKNLSLQKFPTGDLAKGDFFGNYYDLELTDEKAILDQLNQYKTKFGEPDANELSIFYMPIIRTAIQQKDWQKINEYQALLPAPINAAATYNNMAWDMSGQDLVSPGRDLDFAEKLSALSLTMIKERMASPNEKDNPELLQGDYNMYADTYALILYKLGRFDEAYRLQSEIERQGELDTGGKERYAGMALKVKGADYTRDYLEKELSGSTYSKEMLRQLEELYMANNWPMAKFNVIKAQSDSIGREMTRKAVLNMLGDDNAIDFSLVDKNGKQVNLSDYKGQTVVLDFWATWCGPCLASFPKMQQLVEKYKEKDVVFLFINTWESVEKNKLKKQVDKLLQDKKYDFYVLYDFEDEVVKNYKVEGIPTKFVISPEGKVVWANGSDDELDTMIGSLVR